MDPSMFLDPLWAVLGWMLSKLHGFWLRHVRLRRLTRFFGKGIVDTRRACFVLPVFHPFSRAKFDTARTTMNKARAAAERQLESIPVPMVNDVIVVDDYKATEAVNALFARSGGRPVPIVDDETVYQARSAAGCVVCIGGPRSNLVTADVLADNSDFVAVDESGQTLEDWRLILRAPRPVALRSHRDRGLALLLRIANRDNPATTTVLLLGCRGECTMAAGQYLCDHFPTLRRHLPSPRDRLAVVLSVSGGGFATCAPILIATPDKTLLADDHKLAAHAATGATPSADAS